MPGNTIGDWDPSTLTRFIKDILTNQPVQQLSYLLVDSLEVRQRLQANDQAIFEKQRVINYIGQVGQPAFVNAWVNFGGSYEGAGYLRTVDGFVRLFGVIKSGTVGNSAFTLPPGYRPTTLKTLPTLSNNAIGRVDIDTAGVVTPQTPSSNVWVVLDGLTFKSATNPA